MLQILNKIKNLNTSKITFKNGIFHKTIIKSFCNDADKFKKPLNIIHVTVENQHLTIAQAAIEERLKLQKLKHLELILGRMKNGSSVDLAFMDELPKIDERENFRAFLESEENLRKNEEEKKKFEQVKMRVGSKDVYLGLVTALHGFK
jgi:hypothetical protein